MLLFGIEFDADVAGQFQKFAIDTRAHEAFAGQPLDHVTKFALLAVDDRCEQHDARFWRQREDFIDDVTGGLGNDRNAGFGTMRLADIGEEEPQVIVNLSGRGDDRAWVAARAALLNGDGGGKPFDEIDLWLLELIQELARIGRERLALL